MPKEIYIYSGISPGKKGTGSFLTFFLDQFEKHGIEYNLIYYKTPNTGYLSTIAKKLGFIKILRYIYLKIISLIAKKKIMNSIVFIFHPQSIGLKQTTELIKKNEVYIYVLDTFFFCKKSYNYIEGNSPCYKCISNPNASKENNCDFTYFKLKDENYYNFQTAIYNNLSNITFLTQNDNQLLLLKEKFGNKINSRKLGMLINLEDNLINKRDNKLNYDFVFHNTSIKPKGIEFFIKIAKRMVNHSFLIPYNSSDIKSDIKDFQNIDNIDFISMSWETGLKIAVANCKVVINPSLWSAPVEGALLKSIKYNGCVAIVPGDFSFQKEIPLDTVIHLDTDITKSVKILTSILSSKISIENYKTKSLIWLKSYQNNTVLNFKSFFEFLKNYQKHN